MNYRESFRVGLDGLKTHKLRSLLTMLGIIFGVAAVISMLSIGEGAKEEALQQIAQMGMNNIIIQNLPAEDTKEGRDVDNQSRGLQLADALALEEVNPLVSEVVPQRYLNVQAQYGSERVATTVVGTLPVFASVMNYKPQQGAFFNYFDELEARRVCVLGAGIKRDLFYFRDPLGERVKIGDDWFTVVGIMERKMAGGAETAGNDMNQQIYIPLSVSLQRFTLDPFESEIDRIVARINEPERVREAANIIQATLSRRHNNVADYQISIPEELLRQRQRTQRIFNIVMGCIAGISLLVGGIGIMNIMLASVLERTREIGIRRAIGATRKDIMGQFLLEAAMLSFLGGLIGIILGWAMSYLITFYAGWKTIVSFFSIILAFGVSAAVGIIFGFYPARQAAMMDPIESLRYE
ncbi:MAG: ABC transporter permease [candidate division KSB1 bacterium]|nr:ABC transporter permease [candidate division KSB1 bacterium]MDZ7300719.1 ABC transporter permease [candidate division KSB1 bacterium]MDZ7310011.1 ABC transporter permease [candidate division KSB1 bacterium]